jgi:hypothetical protein
MGAVFPIYRNPVKALVNNHAREIAALLEG